MDAPKPWTAPTTEDIGKSELLRRYEEKLFEGPVRFLSRVSFEELPEAPVTQVQDSATTFSALNGTRFQFTNSGAVSVTDITDGQDGQLVLLLGDGQTTLVDNTRLELGANLLLAVDKIYPLMYMTSKWHTLSASTPTAGNGISVSGSTITNKYVGKRVQFLTSQQTHTQSGGGVYEAFAANIQTISDLTNLGQFRLSGYSAGSIAANVRLSYSTDGSSWTTLTTVTLAITTTPGFFTTSFGALAGGAQIATCYLRLMVEQSSGADTLDLSSCSAEFKP